MIAMEFTPSYHKKVLESNHRFQVVRTARRTGKTTLACKYAIKRMDVRERNILFVTPFARQSDLAREMIVSLLGDNVHVNQRGRIVTRDGRQIDFITGDTLATSTRGMRPDKIVVDEFGYINASAMDQISILKIESDARVLMLTSTTKEGSILNWIEERKPIVEYHAYDMYDAIREGIYDRKMLDFMVSEFSNDIFRDEFGPWNKMWYEGSNADFIGLLHK